VADALDPVRTPLPAGQQRALVRLDGVELDAAIALAQEPSDSGEGPAAALRGDEGPDRPAALLPDLGPRGQVVRFDVVGVGELPRHPVARGVGAPDLVEPVEREVDV